MRISFFCLLLCLSSCGYHFMNKPQSTIAISFVKGDDMGLLTSALIENIASCSSFQYKTEDADYALEAEIVGIDNKQIGYRRDRFDDGTVRKKIRPVEGREKVSVQVTLKDKGSSKNVWGPKTFSTDVDYDYVDQDTLTDLSFINRGSRQTVLSFSLGQLESINSAQEAALRPLFQKIAEKIVDGVSAECAR